MVVLPKRTASALFAPSLIVPHARASCSVERGKLSNEHSCHQTLVFDHAPDWMLSKGMFSVSIDGGGSIDTGAGAAFIIPNKSVDGVVVAIIGAPPIPPSPPSPPIACIGARVAAGGGPDNRPSKSLPAEAGCVAGVGFDMPAQEVGGKQ